MGFIQNSGIVATSPILDEERQHEILEKMKELNNYNSASLKANHTAIRRMRINCCIPYPHLVYQKTKTRVIREIRAKKKLKWNSQKSPSRY